MRLEPGFVVVATLVALDCSAVEMPAFRQGVWQYERTAGGKSFAAKECIDPTQEMRSRNASMEKMGCKVSPATLSGSTYTYTTQCAVKLPSGTASWSTTSILTVEGEGAYRLEVHGTGRDSPSDEVIIARRVADCDR